MPAHIRLSRYSNVSQLSVLSSKLGGRRWLQPVVNKFYEWSGREIPDTQDENDEEGKEHLKRALERIQQDSMRYKAGETHPWLDRNGREIWSGLRIFVAKTVRSQSFETFMGIVILSNILIMIFETDADASCYPAYSGDIQNCPGRSSEILWVKVCNVTLQVVYTIECLMRAFVDREKYVWNRWNQLDLLTTIPGWITLALSTQVNFAVFRTLRVVRLLRAGRLLISIPEIYILMSGLASALKPILFGSIMLLSVIILWAIIVVEFLHPTNSQIDYAECVRCPRGFSTVYSACLTLFSQLVAQDNWSELSIPIAEVAPWTTPLMFFILMTVSLGVMNLILAVVVEKAAEARENDQERKMAQKENERERNMIELAVLCDRMDNDGSGALSLQEMLDGFDRDLNFKSLMAHMDIERDDMQTIFKVLDADRSGEVDYVEFCHHLGSCKKRDPLMMSSLTRYSVLELRNLILQTQQEVMEAIGAQTKQLNEQLDLLCHVPGCEKAAQDLKAKRNRLPPMVPTPSFLGTAGFERGISGGSTGPTSVNVHRFGRPGEKVPVPTADEVLDRMTLASKNLETMQNQLDLLVSNAEELQAEVQMAVPDDASAANSERHSERNSERNRQQEALKDDTNEFQRQRFEELDERFGALLQRFQQRFAKEQQMQLKCQNIIASIASMMERPLVQNEL